MSVHTAVFGATIVALAALLGAAFAPGEYAALRGAWHRWQEHRRLPEPWTGDELRAMRADLLAERSRRDGRRNPKREYKRRQHLRAAGFRFAGGPVGRLP